MMLTKEETVRALSLLPDGEFMFRQFYSVAVALKGATYYADQIEQALLKAGAIRKTLGEPCGSGRRRRVYMKRHSEA